MWKKYAFAGLLLVLACFGLANVLTQSFGVKPIPFAECEAAPSEYQVSVWHACLQGWLA